MARFAWIFFLIGVQLPLAGAQSEKPSVYYGLADQAVQTLDVDYNRLSSSDTPKLKSSEVRIITRFLGPEARFVLEVKTDQMWLLLHPEATAITAVPKEQPLHQPLGASFHITYRRGGEPVLTQTAETTVTGAFSPPGYCAGRPHCHGVLTSAAYLLKTTEPLMIPPAGVADEMVVEVAAKDLSSGLMKVFASLSRKLMSGAINHVYALDYQEPEDDWNKVYDFLPFRVLEGGTLKDGAPTEFLYSGERADNVIQGVRQTDPWSPNYPQLLKDYDNTPVCEGVTSGAVDEWRESMREGVFLKYRYDGGPWSELLPFVESEIDEAVLPNVFPQSRWLGEPEIFQGAQVPGSAGHVRLEVAVQLQVFIDVDSAIDLISRDSHYGMDFASHCSLYPQGKGIMIPVGAIWDSPAKDGDSGWVFPIR